MISREFSRSPICRRAIAGGLDSLRRAWALRTIMVVLFGFAATASGLRAQTVSTFASGFIYPNGLAFDTAGNLYVTNCLDFTVSMVTPGGAVSTFASGIYHPAGLAFDTSGNLYVASRSSGTVSKITPGGVTSTFASGFSNPYGLAFDTSGNLFVVDYTANTVSEITPGGVVSIFASGFSGPYGLAFDTSGNLYVTNSNVGTVSKVTPGGVVSTFASGFSGPDGLTFDTSGNLYVANHGANTVNKVTPGGVVSTFASGISGPAGLAFDTSGNLYVANYDAGTVSKVTPTAPTVTTPTSASIAGTTATLGGNVTSDGGATITALGVVYSVTAINSNPQLLGTGVTSVAGTGTIGVFTVSATGLTTGTGYSYAAYATNGLGTTYSSVGTFTATLSTDATLSALALSAGTLAPAFDPGTTSYTATVAYGTTSLTVKPTVNQSNATITVNGKTVASATASGAISLSVGANTITTIVTAQDGTTTQTYTTTIVVPGPAVITWSTPQTISDASDVVTTGTLVKAFYVGGSWGTINDVQFELFSFGDGTSNTATNGNFTFVASPSPANTLSDVNAIYPANPLYSLLSFPYGWMVGNCGCASQPNTLTLTLSGLIAGQQYLFQWWNSNSSWLGSSNSTTATAGNSVTLIANISGEGGDVGQYVTGTFTAVGSTQTIAFDAAPGALYPTINGFQLRTLTAPPTVTTPTSASVGGNTATLGGNVTSDGGATVTERGVVYAPTATNSNPQIGGTGVTKVADAGTGTTGVFTVSATGLTAGTGYSYAAYATNSADTTYSPVGTFTTAVPAPVISSALTANGTYGVAYTSGSPLYRITASNAPTSYSVTGTLPGGITFDTSTGILSGTPTQSGLFNVTVGAMNAGGTGTASLGLTIAKATQTITFAALGNKTYGNAPFTVSGSATSGLSVAFSVLSGPATITGSTVTITGVGIVTIRAAQAGNTNYSAAANVDQSFTVAKATLTVTADNQTRAYGVANPTLTVAYSGFVNSETATALTTAPTTTTTATAASIAGTYAIVPAGGVSANYAFTYVNGTLTIAPAVATVALGNLNATYTGSPHAATASTAPTGLAVALTYNGSSAAPTAAGSYTIVGTVTDSNYTGSASGTLIIGKATQMIQFASVGNVTVGTPVSLSATASSALPVTFSLVSGNATVSGSSLTVNDSSSVTVRATQAGDGNYNAASADQTITGAAKLPQTITFAALPDLRAGDAPFTLTATASSGLPVAFAIVSGPALLNGATLTLGGTPGDVTVRASQPGNAAYNAAPDVVRTFTVVPTGPLIFFGALSSATIAAEIAPNGQSGTLIGTIPGTGDGFLVNFTLTATGSFSAPATVFANPQSGATSVATDAASGTEHAFALTAAASTRTFRGLWSGGVLSGSLDELGLTFSATQQSLTGSTAAIAGYYTAASTNTATGATYSVVGTQGRVYVLAITPNLVTAGSCTIAANSTCFTVQTPQAATIAATIDAPTTTVTGTITLPNQTPQNFSGLNATTVRTDRLVSLSSRAWVNDSAGDAGTLIAGFVITGSVPKSVLLRAIGPSLAAYGIHNPLADPRLILYDATGHVLLENDNWGGTSTLVATQARLGTFALDPASKDAVILTTLAPGTYTMRVAGNGGQGVALAEVYDASANPQSEYQRLVDISTRGPVTAGEGVLVGGFMVTGNSPKKVLVRGVGPGLTAYGVPGALADPLLKVYDSTGAAVAQNDQWEISTPLTAAQTSASPADLSAAFTSTGAFALAHGSKDAALIVVLAPGAYTAVVSGVGGQTGVALVEIYEIPAGN
jgi:sugar lactone lactonase YvrE